VRFAVIDDDVHPTGATKHSHWQMVDGKIVAGPPLRPFAALAIVQYEGDSDHYLVYLDDGWEEVTDSHHETLEGAMLQAEFEYTGITAKWEAVGVRAD
jgi:hypothetical protein